MANSITVAWAIPVDPFILGARIEAYGQCKAAISTLKLCIKYAGSGALAQLPVELQEEIASHVRQPIFEERPNYWQIDKNCCNASCRPLDHLTPEQSRRPESYSGTQVVLRKLAGSSNASGSMKALRKH